MGKSDLDKIESKAKNLLEKIIGDISFIEPPINLAKILENFNLSLAKVRFKDPSVSGAFDKNQKTIYLSKDDSYKRQLFTAAHELGHLVLGHNKNLDIFYRQQASEFNGNLKNDLEEKQANYFAAALLMPEELVKKFWEKKPDIELLAAYFGVSKQAAFWRLKELGLI